MTVYAPIIARAAQRIGTSATVPTDNLLQGGIAAASLPADVCVGQDVYVDRDGTVVIAEGNGRTDTDIDQLETGLLTNPRTRAFYADAGVIESASGAAAAMGRA